MKRILLGLTLLLGMRAYAENDTNPPSRPIPIPSPLTPSSPRSGHQTVGVIDFNTAPLAAVITYLAYNLLHEPLITPVDVYGNVTYRSTNDMTVNEAIVELSSVLQTNGLILTNIDAGYYRLCHAGETTQLTERPHLEVSIVTNRITVDNQNVPASGMLVAIEERLTPRSEIWIRDDGNSTNINSYLLSEMLLRAIPGSVKLFRIYGSRSGTSRPAVTLAPDISGSPAVDGTIPAGVAASAWVPIAEGFGFAITNLVLQEESSRFITNAIEGHFLMRRGNAWYEVRSPSPSVHRPAYPTAPPPSVNTNGLSAPRRAPFMRPGP